MTEQQDQMIADAVKNLRIKWVLRQKVRTVEKAWLVDLFETENERIARQDYDRLVRDNPEVNRRVSEVTALGRPGLPEDIGPLIASLLSEDHRWVNAQRIEVSGGMML